jgi:hypothetical protein
MEDWSQVGDDKQKQVRAIVQIYLQAVKQAESEYSKQEWEARCERDEALRIHGESRDAERRYEALNNKALRIRHDAYSEAKLQRKQALKEIGVIFR